MFPEHNSPSRFVVKGTRTRRRALAVAAGFLLAAGAGGVAIAGGLPFSDSDPSGGMCARTLSAEADLSQPIVKFDPASPAKACADSWQQMWNDTPEPASFVACYHPGATAGGSVIYPAAKDIDAATACVSIGSKPIKGSAA
ncbi:hypothetical protein [Actinoplanes xinjiangensis]|uniref:hypothetical protein n=1 Tax=Actinoplanes xinjiangensis TaxID=512350 RepID=UPI00343C6AAA